MIEFNHIKSIHHDIIVYMMIFANNLNINIITNHMSTIQMNTNIDKIS